MFFRRPKYRRFDYEPRFYQPERDPGEKFRERMQREMRRARKKRKPIFLWVAVFALIIYFYLYVSGIIR
ncbi:MAG: hypothetical protein FJ215_10140 [Ignavibacteria bacterium]|nr:hypothetical protein [Ignavibacteria bacterium]